MNRSKFSIFLDFDGVLNDFLSIPNLTKFGGFLVKKNDQKVFNPESIEALNILISTLESTYSVELVLTSFWRFNVDKCRSVLKSNGLQFDGEINSIPFMINKSRIKEILSYIKSQNIDKYVIIDDFPNIDKYFDKKNIIKTSLYGKSLNISNILNYVDTNLPELSKNINITNMYFSEFKEKF